MAKPRKYTDEELFETMEEIITERQKWKNTREILMRPYVFGPLLLIFILFGPLLSSNKIINMLIQYIFSIFTK
jgi:hypothetical protein